MRCAAILRNAGLVRRRRGRCDALRTGRPLLAADELALERELRLRAARQLALEADGDRDRQDARPLPAREPAAAVLDVPLDAVQRLAAVAVAELAVELVV